MQVTLAGIDTNLLVLLDALLQVQSVSIAAGRVGLSQSAMSHALGRLRRHFADELLTRAGRKLVMTPRGADLQPLVREAVVSMERVFAPETPFSPGTSRRSFSLILSELLEMTLLPELDQQLRNDAPGVDLFTLPAALNTLEELREGRADAAVTVRGESPGDLSKLVMMRGEYVVIMRRGHHLADCGPPAIEDFVDADHVLVAPRGQPGSIIDHHLAELGLERRVARRVSSFWAAMVLVARSEYIAILPRAAVQTMKDQIELASVPPPFPLAGFAYDLVWHNRLDGDPAQQWFRQVLLQCAEQVAASGLS